METLTTNEMLAAKERELANCERKLAERERELRAREKKVTGGGEDPRPWHRLTMLVIAQLLGGFLLNVLGFSTFDPRNEKIALGLNFMKQVFGYYSVLSLLVLLLLGALVYLQRRLKQWHVDTALLCYVVIDITLLLFLVHQQGGLCRSMFLPVFFLIPTAYMFVERREKKMYYRLRRMGVLLIIVACLYRSYGVAAALLPGDGHTAGGAAEGTAYLFWWSGQVTDFSALAHGNYDNAVFIASLISAGVPIMQLVVLLFKDREVRLDDEGEGHPVSQATAP